MEREIMGKELTWGACTMMLFVFCISNTDSEEDSMGRILRKTFKGSPAAATRTWVRSKSTVAGRRKLRENTWVNWENQAKKRTKQRTEKEKERADDEIFHQLQMEFEVEERFA